MGRALAIGLLLLAVLAVLYLLARWAQRRRAIVAAGTDALWQVHHYTDDAGDTVVAVRRAGRLPSGELHAYEVKRVDTIPGGDPDWDARFRAATKAAENRAFTLNYPSIGE